MMEIIAGLAVGFLFGMCCAFSLASDIKKKNISSGGMEFGGKFYKILEADLISTDRQEEKPHD